MCQSLSVTAETVQSKYPGIQAEILGCESAGSHLRYQQGYLVPAWWQKCEFRESLANSDHSSLQEWSTIASIPAMGVRAPQRTLSD